MKGRGEGNAMRNPIRRIRESLIMLLVIYGALAFLALIEIIRP